MARPATSRVEMIAPQDPSLLGSRGGVGEVDQTTLSVPDVFTVSSHPISGFDRYALPHRHVIHDKDALACWAAYQETLMLVPAKGIREYFRDARCHRYPLERDVVAISSSHRGAPDPGRASGVGQTRLWMRQTDCGKAAD